MDIFAIVFLGVMLIYTIYSIYELWVNPERAWKKYRARRVRVRAWTKNNILSIFDVGANSWENDMQKYVFSNRVWAVIWLVWLIVLLSASIWGK
jgi:Gpi18-like mannosyltransferase